MDYERGTRSAYRSEQRAKVYKEQYTNGLKWARFTMWRERVIIKRALKECNLRGNEKILDFPHGTGTLTQVLADMPSSYVAADISLEMMAHVPMEINSKKTPLGFVQADITSPPFQDNAFACVITLSLMHRLPAEIRKEILGAVKSLARRNLIISYSIDSKAQRLKQWLVNRIKSGHEAAPNPIPLKDIIEEITSHGLKIRKIYKVVSFLSAGVIFFLEKVR